MSSSNRETECTVENISTIKECKRRLGNGIAALQQAEQFGSESSAIEAALRWMMGDKAYEKWLEKQTESDYD